MLSKTHRLLLGVIIVLLVDFISVSTNAIHKYSHEKRYNKPFFCAYFKTAALAFYLLMMGFLTPIKDRCERSSYANYALMEQNVDEEKCTTYTNKVSLSDPTYVPIRTAGVNNPGSGPVSDSESDDASVRSVRFCKLAEVREMSEHEATEALMSRLSYTASLRVRRQRMHHKTAKTALYFSVLWFLADYLLHISLQMGEESMVHFLSSFSSLFTLLLTLFIPSSPDDKINFCKLLAALLHIAGVAQFTIHSVQEIKFSKVYFATICSALSYATYLVSAKRKNDVEDKLDITLFLGFVGLWSVLLLWPVFFFLDYFYIEKFELPDQNQLASLCLDGLVNIMTCEALLLWGCFLSSSLLCTIVLSLKIPISVLFDTLVVHRDMSTVFYKGSLLLVLPILLLILFSNNVDSDSPLRQLKTMIRKIFRCRRSNMIRINDEEQQESLLVCSNND